MLAAVRDFYRRGRPDSPEERRLLTKIDLTLLPIVCLMYWSNYLNRSNYAFAYTSGMRQELGFQGDDFTNTNSVFSGIYCVAQIPHAILVPRLPSRYYFPAMALVWSVFSIGLAFAQNLLASWYKEDELGKRSALFACSAQLGSLFSGVLQGAIQSNLNGAGGRSGWRNTFIVDGGIGMAIALAGFVLLPSVPKQGANQFYKPHEIQLALDRLPRRDRELSIFSKRALKQIFGSWVFWGFGALFAIGTQLEAYSTNGIMQQWFAIDFPVTEVSVAQRSYYSLGLTSVAIVTTVVAGICTDIFGRRWLTVFPCAVPMIISASILLAWDHVSTATKRFAFYLGGCGLIQQGPFFAWANDASRSDVERGATLFGMNLWSNAVNAWWVLIFWPVSTAPRYTRGFISTIPIACATMIIASSLRYVELRSRKRHRAQLQADSSAEAQEHLADPLPDEKPVESKF